MAVSRELVLRVEHAIADRTRRVYTHIADLPGDPIGTEYHRVGKASSYLVRSLPEVPYCHRITGLERDESVDFDALLAPFDRTGIVPRIEVWPSEWSSETAQELKRRGFAPEDASAALWRSCASVLATSSTVEVEEAIDESDRSVAIETMLHGFAFAARHQPMFLAENSLPGLRLFTARLEGQVVAAGSLLEHAGVAYLGAAATVESARGKGAQTALVQARLTAARSRCDIAVVTTAIESPSRRNLERMGFALVHERARWRRDPSLPQ